MENPIENAVQSSFSDAAGAREATFRATGGIVAAAVATWALAVLAGGTTSYLLAALATSHAVEAPDPPAKPNFLLIFTDDHGYGDVSA